MFVKLILLVYLFQHHIKITVALRLEIITFYSVELLLCNSRVRTYDIVTVRHMYVLVHSNKYEKQNYVIILSNNFFLSTYVLLITLVS